MKYFVGFLIALTSTCVTAAPSAVLPTQLVVPDTNGFIRFAGAIAIEGDRMVLGAPGSGTFLTGAAYAYAREDGQWKLKQHLLPPHPLPTFGYYGASVALSGDALVISVGAESSSEGQTYVYRADTKGWALEQIIPARGLVAIDGDTIVVTDYGATVQRGAAEFGEAGAAEVYVRSNGVWSMQQRLTAGDPIDSGYFGRDVVIQSDTLVIGAIGDLSTSDESGAAYVFMRDGIGRWAQTQKLRASAPQRAGDFGRAIVLKGDLLVIGAPGYVDWTDQYPKPGYAYIFTRAGNTWTEQQRLSASDTTPRNGFGYSVAIDGRQVIVGQFKSSAPTYDGLRSGAAYIFSERGGEWVERGKIVPDVGDAPDLFGTIAAADGDTLVMGDPKIQGSAYVYERLVISRLRRDTAGLKISFGTDPNRTYAIKTAGSLQSPIDWQTIKIVTGDGSVTEIPLDPAGRTRFYHVVVEP